ncbi:GGDEF domain-containing protein [Oceanithermus desulfurans]|uniref:GGDEF domain-containing protein n=2 Tax=Oceanithermus desulfurans TaxID=227924 RepID=A0A511RG74_9DEIN|nr:GGDEF domain-containing protein [Oceanithermus desulfurans]MBB6030097.1 diguanylate cyclase (GGDEF)-like protein [Oceanithermus desulfurans]GEM88655.1 GGDEF domain-containing protein [Oceanithermus desulfurans NBRC 100063]
MKEHTTGSGHITLLERVSATPFGRVRRVLVIGVLLLGAVASLTALYLQVAIEATNPVDLTFLPLMFVLFLGMTVALVYRPDKLHLVENAAYLMLVLYGLSMLVFQVRYTLPELHTFSETMFWFPMLYLVAYLLHRRAMAFRIAAGIWVATLVLGLVFTPFGELWRNKDAGAFNALLQFYISGIVYAMLLYAFSRIEESYAENRMLAYLDHLTQLPNRRYGEAVLVHLFRQVREHGGTFSVIMLDLDGFKKVNDRHGHDVGDRVLKRCALLIQRYLPRGARVIRWGGEEFLIVLPDLDEGAALAVAEEVRRGLERSPHERVGPVLASLGVAGCRPGDALDTLIQRADQAMYLAKQNGGNRVVAFSQLLQTAQA